MLYSLYLYSLSIIVTGYYSIEYSRIKMNKYQRWFLLNMVLPIVPFIIKVFIFSMSNKGIIELSKIAELPQGRRIKNLRPSKYIHLTTQP